MDVKLSILLGIMVIASLLLGYLAHDIDFNTYVEVGLEGNDTLETCEFLPTVKERSNCVIAVTIDKFKYAVTPDEMRLTDAQLFERGGDCLDWSRYYKKLGESYGYYTELVVIQMNETARHAFTTWSNDTEICVLDQKKVVCW